MAGSILAVKLSHTDEEFASNRSTLLAVLSSDAGARTQGNAFVLGQDCAINQDLELYVSNLIIAIIEQ